MKKSIAWKIGADGKPHELQPGLVELEKHLEGWIDSDVRIVADDVLLIGRQVETKFKTYVDLLGIDAAGRLVVIELKRDKTLRETIAQALEYAACMAKLTAEDALGLASARYGSEDAFGIAFLQKFGTEIPTDEINRDQRVLVVAPTIDDNTAEVIDYLANAHDFPINAVSFDVFGNPGEQTIVRHYVLDTPPPPPPQSPKKTRSVEQFMDEAMRNGVGEIFQHLLGLQDILPIQERFWQSMALKAKTTDKRTLAGFSMYPAAETNPGALFLTMSAENLAALFSVSVEHAGQFISSLADVCQPAKSWGTWDRVSMTTLEQAQEFERRFRAFAAARADGA